MMGSTAAGASGTSTGDLDDELIDLDSVGDLDCLVNYGDRTGEGFDILEWHSNCDLGDDDGEDEQLLSDIQAILTAIQKNDVSSPDRQKFDSRTYVRPKKRVQRPSIHTMVEGIASFAHSSPNTNELSNQSHIRSSNQISNSGQMTNACANQLHNASANKFLTYNKYNNPISPMLRLKTFNVEAGTENSGVVKDYAMKRRSLHQEDEKNEMDPQTVDDRSSPEHTLSKPINIDLSQPAHNLHNTFNRGMSGPLSGHSDRDSLNMFRSGNSFMNMSPPSLVNSLIMETSTVNLDSMASKRDSGVATSARASLDPHSMLDSMTLSIMDEKDMSTSFLSQSTYQENDSLIGSLPPSLASSVNSSYVATKHRPENSEHSLISSGTFTTLIDSSERLTSRPRAQLFHRPRISDSYVRKSESYTKSRDEDAFKNVENISTNAKPYKSNDLMNETVSVYSNDRYSSPYDEKENEFQKDDTFFKDMQKEDMQRTIDLGRNSLRNDVQRNLNLARNNEMQRTIDLGRNSLNVTIDKQELNEIIQARQKLSLARNALPPQNLPNQIEPSPNRTIQLANQTVQLTNRTRHLDYSSEPRHLPNERSPNRTLQLVNQTIELTNQTKHLDNSSESGYLHNERSPNRTLQSVNQTIQLTQPLDNWRRKMSFEERQRETPKRNATFKKPSPKREMDATMVYVNSSDTIDIDMSTVNLVDVGNRTLQQEELQEWGSQERAMVGSSDSVDTATISSSSPPEGPVCDVHERNAREQEIRLNQVASTPLGALKRGANDLLHLHHAISPIYDDQPNLNLNMGLASGLTGGLTMRRSPSKYSEASKQTMGPDVRHVPINTATLVRKPMVKRDILAKSDANDRQPNSRQSSRVSPTAMAPPPSMMARKTGLPTSKLRQYSSHKELNRIPAAPPTRVSSLAGGGGIQRRPVYASNPALSPTAPHPQMYDADLTIVAGRRSPSPRQSPAKSAASAAPPVPPLVRQGTETLRRPHSQLLAPKDIRCGSAESAPSSYTALGSVLMRNKSQLQPPSQRPSSIASVTQLRVRPNVPAQKPVPVAPPPTEVYRSTSAGAGESAPTRGSGLPRPSRLPAPRRSIRPPSVYSVAPSAVDNADHY